MTPEGEVIVNPTEKSLVTNLPLAPSTNPEIENQAPISAETLVRAWSGPLGEMKLMISVICASRIGQNFSETQLSRIVALSRKILLLDAIDEVLDKDFDKKAANRARNTTSENRILMPLVKLGILQTQPKKGWERANEYVINPKIAIEILERGKNILKALQMNPEIDLGVFGNESARGAEEIRYKIIKFLLEWVRSNEDRNEIFSIDKQSILNEIGVRDVLAHKTIFDFLVKKSVLNYRSKKKGQAIFEYRAVKAIDPDDDMFEGKFINPDLKKAIIGTLNKLGNGQYYSNKELTKFTSEFYGIDINGALITAVKKITKILREYDKTNQGSKYLEFKEDLDFGARSRIEFTSEQCKKYASLIDAFEGKSLPDEYANIDPFDLFAIRRIISRMRGVFPEAKEEISSEPEEIEELEIAENSIEQETYEITSPTERTVRQIIRNTGDTRNVGEGGFAVVTYMRNPGNLYQDNLRFETLQPKVEYISENDVSKILEKETFDALLKQLRKGPNNIAILGEGEEMDIEETNSKILEISILLDLKKLHLLSSGTFFDPTGNQIISKNENLLSENIQKIIKQAMEQALTDSGTNKTLQDIIAEERSRK